MDWMSKFANSGARPRRDPERPPRLFGLLALATSKIRISGGFARSSATSSCDISKNCTRPAKQSVQGSMPSRILVVCAFAALAAPAAAFAPAPLAGLQLRAAPRASQCAQIKMSGGEIEKLDRGAFTAYCVAASLPWVGLLAKMKAGVKEAPAKPAPAKMEAPAAVAPAALKK
jgi:hypothetical protein